MIGAIRLVIQFVVAMKSLYSSNVICYDKCDSLFEKDEGGLSRFANPVGIHDHSMSVSSAVYMKGAVDGGLHSVHPPVSVQPCTRLTSYVVAYEGLELCC